MRSLNLPPPADDTLFVRQTPSKIDGDKVEAVPEVVLLPPKVDYSGAQEKTNPREIALVKKLDWRIMPMLWSMYWLNYLDRNAITLARLNNLEEMLGLSDNQYLACVSICFGGYVIGQIPSNMLLTRVRPSRYMGIMMALWAVVSALTAAANNFISLLVLRFFLGVTEAPFYPGAIYLLSRWYTRKEIATRIAILYTGNILATAFAGLIAAGTFYGLDGVQGLAGWQWLFVLQGAVTLVVAVLGYFLLPDYPLTTRWLNKMERKLAHDRMERDTVANAGETGLLSGLKEAVKDPLVWVFAAMAHLHLAANGFKNMFPTVVETLGFSRDITLVLTCPPYLIAGVITILVSWSSGKVNERTWHITFSKALASIGFITCAMTMDLAGRYISMIIFAIGTYAVNSLILGWCGSVCGQTKEKKAASISIVTTVMNVSFIWTPFIWQGTDKPRFMPALVASAAFSMGTAMLAWLANVLLRRRNRQLRASQANAQVFYVL